MPATGGRSGGSGANGGSANGAGGTSLPSHQNYEGYEVVASGGSAEPEYVLPGTSLGGGGAPSGAGGGGVGAAEQNNHYDLGPQTRRSVPPLSSVGHGSSATAAALSVIYATPPASPFPSDAPVPASPSIFVESLNVAHDLMGRRNSDYTMRARVDTGTMLAYTTNDVGYMPLTTDAPLTQEDFC